jgi:bifunctional DNase/RNase
VGLYKARVPALLAVVFLLGGGVYTLWRNGSANQVSAAGVFPIEVSVQDLQPAGTSYTLTLREKAGSQRRVSMNVGATEAFVIARERGMVVNAPVFHGYELTRDVIQQLGGHVDRVVIHDADQTQYYSQVIVSNGLGESHTVRARPADAVALALKAGAPIYVEDQVLDRFGVRANG